MIDSLPDFLYVLRRSRLLNPAQMNELKLQHLGGVSQPGALADRLVEFGWLTSFQVDRLLEGDDGELVLGPFRLLDLLGEGGLCKVYKAWSTTTQNLVALKVIHPELRSNPEVLEQFWLEMEVIYRLDHPNIVKPFFVNLEGSAHYFAMEYVPGLDLLQLIKAAGPLPLAQACDYVRQAALGLEYAYELGLVHRDIKPANLFATHDGNKLLILDIGLARLEWAYHHLPASAAPQRNEGLTLMGTPDYVAPEQVTNPNEADIRADVYSLGCSFYFLLTGKVPFPGNSLALKLLHHQQSPPPSVRHLRPEVPPELDALLQRMMAKQPDDRYRTPAKIAVALVPFCHAEGPRVSVEQYRPPDRADDKVLRQLARRQEEAEWSQPLSASEQGRRAPPAPSGNPDGQERRVYPRRVGSPTPVLIVDPPSQAEPLRGWVLNRSQGGLGLLVEEALEIGQVVRLWPDASTPLARWVEVRIVYCFKERLRWRVGCQFLQKLSWDELRMFG